VKEDKVESYRNLTTYRHVNYKLQNEKSELIQNKVKCMVTVYRCGPVSTGNTFQDLLQLRETADNTDRYI
jgi:hypothetical protein